MFCSYNETIKKLKGVFVITEGEKKMEGLNQFPGNGWEKLPNRLLDPDYFEETMEELNEKCGRCKWKYCQKFASDYDSGECPDFRSIYDDDDDIENEDDLNQI